MTVTVTVVEHPLVADALARIRDRTTPNALFRQNLERIGTLLLAEATETLPTVETTVDDAADRARRPGGWPCSRWSCRSCAPGSGSCTPPRSCCPTPTSGSSGSAATRRRSHPKPYVNKLPESLAGRPVIVDRPDAGDRRVARAHVRAAARARTRRCRSSSCARCAAPEGIERLREAGLTRARRHRRRSTTTSTTRPSSSPASATPATASSARRLTGRVRRARS